MKYGILIIDDDDERRESLSALLKDADYDVETAGSKILSENTANKSPNLIIACPNFEQKEKRVGQIIRSQAKWQTVPILLLGTLKSDDPLILEELNGGANAYVRMPYQPVSLATVISRIIEREKVEKTVREIDDRFLTLIENSTDLITVMSLDGTIYYESPSVRQILGREPLIDRNAFDYIHPEDRRRVAAYVKKSVSHPPRQISVEYRYRHSSGSWCYLQSVGRLVSDPTRGKILVVNSRDVTKRKVSEEALRESEEKFKAQYKNIPIPTYTWQKVGDDFIFFDYNDAADKVTKGRLKKILGEKASWMYSHAPHVIEHLHKCFNEKTVINDEFEYIYRTTGETRNLQLNFVYVPPDLVMAHARDVTEVMETAESLRISENRFQLAALVTNDALWDWNLMTDEIWLNDGFYKMSGYERNKIKPSFDFWKSKVHPEDLEGILKKFNKFIESDEFYFSSDYRYLRGDGSYADIFDRSYAVRDKDGKTVRMIGAMLDLTERRKVEEAMRFQALLLDTVQQAVIATDLDVKITYWNNYAEKIFGWTAAQVLNRNALDLLIPAALRRDAEAVVSELRRGKNWAGELMLQRRDGTAFPAQLINSTVQNERGEEVGILGILTDITGQKLAEKENISLTTEIQTQRQRLNAIIANVPGIVWESELTPDGTAQQVNFVSDYAERMLGYSTEEWTKQPNFWLRIMHPEDGEHAHLDIQDLIRNGGKSVQQYRWIAKDKNIIWVETQMVLITDGDGKPFSLRGISIDITERKSVEDALQKSEDQLRQSQKLESVGRLAGGIAHDFNNMLTAINGYSDLILRELGDEDSLRNKVLEIKKAGDRSAALTHQLLAFSRRQVLQPKLIDLNKTVSEMNQLLNRLIGEDIQLKINLSPQICCVEADPGQLSQVILNLVVNARDAMPQGGDLIVKTEKVSFQDEPVAQFAPQIKSDYIKLSVVDTGIGIEDKDLEQIFEPFFTTKQAGVGTGLGLSTVYGIIKQSGGFVWVDTRVGVGSEFNIYLRYVEEKAVEKKERKPPEQFPHGTETILLVEDEEMVRNLTRRILEVCGYTVIEAKNGIEALKICEESDCHIDLLMTDVVMPQMNGRELSERFAALDPKIRTLFTSGYMNDRIMRLGISAEAVNFIQKPFAPDVLARKVREMLDQKQ